MITLKKLVPFCIFFILGCHNANQSKIKKPAMLFIGDSLTAGFGVDAKDNYVSLIGDKLAQDKIDIRLINKAVSGMKTADAIKILDNLFIDVTSDSPFEPRFVYICLGANDLLHGQLEQAEENLPKMVKFAKEKGLVVILAPPKFPYGDSNELTLMQRIAARPFTSDYLADVKRLNNIYQSLDNEGTHLFPPVTEPIPLGTVSFSGEYMQKDQIHPNEKGHKLIAETLYPHFKKFFAKHL